MKKEKIGGVIKSSDSWERDSVELKKSSIEEAIDNYYNISCEEINIVAKTLSLILMIPRMNGIHVSFKSLGHVYKDTREIIIEYDNNNLGFIPKEISIMDQSALNDNGAVKIFNRFLYDLKNCSSVERLQNITMLEDYFTNYIKGYKEFPGTYLKIFKHVEINVYDGKFVIYASKHKKAIDFLDELE